MSTAVQTKTYKKFQEVIGEIKSSVHCKYLSVTHSFESIQQRTQFNPTQLQSDLESLQEAIWLDELLQQNFIQSTLNDVKSGILSHSKTLKFEIDALLAPSDFLDI